MPNPQFPLIDLHRHLDGNIRPKTIWQLAEQHQIALPCSDFEQFIPYVTITKAEPDLVSFLAKLDWGVKVLKTLDDCKRIAFENVEDVYLAGIDYAELRFSPYYMAMTHHLPMQEVVAAVIDGVKQGMKAFPVKINLIGILSRTFGTEACMQELNALLAHKERLVAIDLAGDELNQPGELFTQHFKKAYENGLNITVHAGEAAGSESIWQAINHLHASRIGHGVAAAGDPKLLDYMAQHHIGVESCLTSNYQTGTVPDLAKHPVSTFLTNGLLVNLNTDDPAVEGIELKHEYQLAAKLGLTQQQRDKLQQNAFTMSFLSETDKQALRQNVDKR